MRTSVVFGLALLLAACGSEPPPCHFDGRADTSPSAGCLVVDNGRILLVETPRDKFGPPGGVVAQGEPSQCGAERETWEETGIRVRAGDLFQRFGNGFRLYRCYPVGDIEIDVQRRIEIGSAAFYAPSDFEQLQWRFPGQAAILIEAIQQAGTVNEQ